MNDYKIKLERDRRRQAELSRVGRDIGELPTVADPARRARGEKSLLVFAETYFRQRFSLAWSPDHRRLIAAIQRTILSGGRVAFALPRGSGKTTICEVAVMWAACTGKRRYAALIGATKEHGDEMLDSIRGELETNDLLAADYPEICLPIQALEGLANRCRGQVHLGERTRMRWAGSSIVLPTIRQFTEKTKKPRTGKHRYTPASGAIISVRGITGRIRGMKFTRSDGESARPDLAVIDDPQTDESAKSPSQVNKRLRIMTGAIMGLAGPGKSIAAFCPCTIIEPGDLAAQLLDRKEHPEWHGIRTQLVHRWPDSVDLWEQYAELRRADFAADDGSDTAGVFYRRHREKMDAGGEVAWAERKLPTEISAIQHAYNLRIDSPETFDAEYQNDPQTEDLSDSPVPTAADLLTRISGHSRDEIPENVQRLTWFIDVQKALLYYAVIAWESSLRGHLIRYGTWPEQRTKYFLLRDAKRTIQNSKEITATTLEGQISQALDALFGELSVRSWVRSDGADLGLSLGLVDANWGETTDQVYDACKQARLKHGLRVMPSHGVPYGAGKKPISRYDRKQNKGAKIGDEWMIPPLGRGRSVRHVVFDASRRKTFLFRRLSTPAGDPGSLTFHHAPVHEHKMLADQLTSNTAVKVSGPHGELYEYRLIPGRDDHLLDCLSGATTAESIEGGKLPVSVAKKPGNAQASKEGMAAKRRQRQRVTYL